MTRRLRAPAAVAVAAGLTLSLVACGSGHKPAVVAAPSPSSSPKPKPVAKPSNRSPLTGLVGGVHKPVLVVKIDNTRPSHPQIGVNDADVVYLEEVEGGLTRLAAVFSSTLPSTVGPVRSARETDINLFAQYGRVAYAYSGGQPSVVRQLHRTNMYLEPDGFGSGWFRDFGRHAPYNLFASPAKLLAARPHAAQVRDVGFRFGPIVRGMQPTNGFDVSYQAAHVAWRWSPTRHGFVLSMDGSPAGAVGYGQIKADNVIVQYVRVFASQLRDVNGMHTPYTVTTGQGHAVFFRDGRQIAGWWKRPTRGSGTAWMVGRQRYRMHPGRTWVILVPSGSRIRFA